MGGTEALGLNLRVTDRLGEEMRIQQATNKQEENQESTCGYSY